MARKNETPKGVNETVMSAEQVQQVLNQNAELLKRVEELEKKQPKPERTYEEQIQFFQFQQQVIGHLQKFQDKRGVIAEATKLVKEKTESGDFETKIYTLSLTATNGEKKTVFNITNPLVISTVLDSVTVEIDTKIKDLKGKLTL